MKLFRKIFKKEKKELDKTFPSVMYVEVGNRGSLSEWCSGIPGTSEQSMASYHLTLKVPQLTQKEYALFDHQEITRQLNSFLANMQLESKTQPCKECGDSGVATEDGVQFTCSCKY